MSRYRHGYDEVEAKQLRLLNSEEIELLVGGDTGRCPKEHAGCMIFATKQGALHVRLRQYVVKWKNGLFTVEDEQTFKAKYQGPFSG